VGRESKLNERSASSARIGIHHHGRIGLVAVDGFPNFLAMHRHVLGRYDPEANLVAANLYHRNNDILVNYDAFIFFSGQNQHGLVSFSESEIAASIRNYPSGSRQVLQTRESPSRRKSFPRPPVCAKLNPLSHKVKHSACLELVVRALQPSFTVTVAVLPVKELRQILPKFNWGSCENHFMRIARQRSFFQVIRGKSREIWAILEKDLQCEARELCGTDKSKNGQKISMSPKPDWHFANFGKFNYRQPADFFVSADLAQGIVGR
jgi:hypothetical protein